MNCCQLKLPSENLRCQIQLLLIGNLFCVIYVQNIIDNPVQLGGPGMTVEIDKSFFTQHKYNRGRMVREQWVFCGIDITTKKCFLIPAERRDAATHCAAIH